ncbi:hypothetical protein BK120_20420 [Paenibacillus sp. FSL A5-0031]|uniref:hypothetical protein n=1 Tax=Paenibacillus sp. FSL A5-0031 TaxID=1920420 RepID=UPI00096C7A08|nr:hypothetical protein [Paenibacillus sp. FSL A5-0031]OME80194.1 hypothetical protein BK120_20420 [Paenibacillus sp. FSL A5-0031]
MSTTLSGDLIALLGKEVFVMTNGFGQLAVIGRLDQVGNDFILVSFDQDRFLYELRIFYANIIYVHENPAAS